MSCRYLVALLALALAGMQSWPAAAAEPVGQLRLYAINCGDMHALNKGMFSDTGEYDGQTHEGISVCFLVRHPKGTLLWNTGVGDEYAGQENGRLGALFTIHLQDTLTSELQKIGLAPSDIDFIGFTHFHGDHTGNAKNFMDATWIVSRAEVDAATSTPPRVNANPDFLKALASAKKQPINGDHDVFGDGSVRTLKTPGHTPGHQSLMLQLPRAGTVVLSGDLYHMRDNRKFHRVPGGNSSRADTLASFDRLDTIVKNRKARLVIDHDRDDFARLPTFPAWLD